MSQVSGCVLLQATAAIFTNATTVPTVTSTAKLDAYGTVAAFNATEQARVGTVSIAYY